MTDAYQTAGDIRRALASILDHYDIALHPPRRGSGSGGKASKEPPPPVSVDVIDARWDTHRDLIHYTQVILLECRSAEGREITTPVDATSITALVRFIDVWAEQLAHGNPVEAAACARDLGANAAKLQGMALPDRHEWMSLGTCPLEIQVDDETILGCGGQVRAYPEREPQCQKCGATATTESWEFAINGSIRAEISRDELPEFIHRAFGRQVARPTLHRWIKSGELVRVDYVRTTEWFNRAEVIDAVAARWEPVDKLA